MPSCCWKHILNIVYIILEHLACFHHVQDGDMEEFEYKEVVAFHKLFQADCLGFLNKEVRVEDVNAVGLPCNLNISIG